MIRVKNGIASIDEIDVPRGYTHIHEDAKIHKFIFSSFNPIFLFEAIELIQFSD